MSVTWSQSRRLFARRYIFRNLVEYIQTVDLLMGGKEHLLCEFAVGHPVAVFEVDVLEGGLVRGNCSQEPISFRAAPDLVGVRKGHA